MRRFPIGSYLERAFWTVVRTVPHKARHGRPLSPPSEYTALCEVLAYDGARVPYSALGKPVINDQTNAMFYLSNHIACSQNETCASHNGSLATLGEESMMPYALQL